MSLITCNNLSKHYGNNRALDGVSFELQSGSPIALVGPNGAGKTTLFSLLCGFIRPTKGSITLLGHNPGSPELLKQMAALPQDASLDPNFSIHAQLSYLARLQGMTAKNASNEALRVLELVELAHVAKDKPASLSHGMAKRVAIAQALMGSPKLVLLDEPTAGLDPANAKAIRDLVKGLSGETTFIISSHNLDELEKLCDQVLYLDKGKLSQSVSIQESIQADYLTLTMQTCDDKVLIDTLNAHSAIESVSSKQANEFLIQYKPEQAQGLEIYLFEQFQKNNWQYKMLIKGRTLEDTLFS